MRYSEHFFRSCCLLHGLLLITALSCFRCICLKIKLIQSGVGLAEPGGSLPDLPIRGTDEQHLISTTIILEDETIPSEPVVITGTGRYGWR